MGKEIAPASTITGPECKHIQTEAMPTGEGKRGR